MNKDRISGIILLIFCAFFYYQSTLIKTKELTGLQATFFPRLLLSLITILAIVLIIQSFLKKENTSGDENQNQKGRIVWIIFVLFSFYIAAIKILGFILSSFLFMAIVYLIIVPDKKSLRGHLLPISGLLAIAIALSLIFEQFLNVYLPKGIFF